MACWVNGYLVTDWTDERKVNENPRNGCRTEAGTFQLQGHDATTEFRFAICDRAELPAANDRKFREWSRDWRKYDKGDCFIRSSAVISLRSGNCVATL